MTSKTQDQIAPSQQRCEANLGLFERSVSTPWPKSCTGNLKSTYASYLRGLDKEASRANVAAAHCLTNKVVVEANQLALF